MALRTTIEYIIQPAIDKQLADAINVTDRRVNVDCYVKVVTVQSNKESAVAMVEYSTFVDRIGVKVESRQFVPDMDGGNFIKQAYEHLNTLPEFADAVDC